MNRVAVTGGSGFIGTNLVAHLRGLGHTVRNLDLAPPVDRTAASLWRPVDVRDGDVLCAELEDFAPTAIVHLAARTDLRGQRVADYAANTDGVRHLLDAVGRLPGLTRVLFASSRMVMLIGQIPEDARDYQPPNAYGRSKAIGEQLVREAGLRVPWAIVRPTSIWGPWFGVPYRDFFDSVLGGRYVHPNGRRIPKSFGYVGNTVHQLERLLAAPADAVDGTTLYLADYQPLDVRAWAGEITRQAGRAAPRSVPLAVLRAAAGAGTLLERAGRTDVPLTRFRLANLLTPMVHDMTELERIVGPCPFDMETGVRDTLAYLGSAAAP